MNALATLADTCTENFDKLCVAVTAPRSCHTTHASCHAFSALVLMRARPFAPPLRQLRQTDAGAARAHRASGLGQGTAAHAWPRFRVHRASSPSPHRATAAASRPTRSLHRRLPYGWGVTTQ